MREKCRKYHGQVTVLKYEVVALGAVGVVLVPVVE